MDQPQSLLLIEDDDCIRNLTKMYLQLNGFKNICTAADGEHGMLLARKSTPDLILLDIMLPGIDGVSLLKNLRQDSILKEVPVILLSAKGEEEDIVAGLESGANDYIVKPFSNNILLARIKVQLRKDPAGGDHKSINLLDLHLDAVSHQVSCGGVKLEMTADEFSTLWLLAQSPEKVFTRRQIIQAVKGGDYQATDRIVDIRLMKLRKKLANWCGRIETVRGVGYKIALPEDK